MAQQVPPWGVGNKQTSVQEDVLKKLMSLGKSVQSPILDNILAVQNVKPIPQEMPEQNLQLPGPVGAGAIEIPINFRQPSPDVSPAAEELPPWEQAALEEQGGQGEALPWESAQLEMEGPAAQPSEIAIEDFEKIKDITPEELTSEDPMRWYKTRAVVKNLATNSKVMTDYLSKSFPNWEFMAYNPGGGTGILEAAPRDNILIRKKGSKDWQGVLDPETILGDLGPEILDNLYDLTIGTALPTAAGTAAAVAATIGTGGTMAVPAAMAGQGLGGFAAEGLRQKLGALAGLEGNESTDQLLMAGGLNTLMPAMFGTRLGQKPLSKILAGTTRAVEESPIGKMDIATILGTKAPWINPAEHEAITKGLPATMQAAAPKGAMQGLGYPTTQMMDEALSAQRGVPERAWGGLKSLLAIGPGHITGNPEAAKSYFKYAPEINKLNRAGQTRVKQLAEESQNIIKNTVYNQKNSIWSELQKTLETSTKAGKKINVQVSAINSLKQAVENARKDTAALAGNPAFKSSMEDLENLFADLALAEKNIAVKEFKDTGKSIFVSPTTKKKITEEIISTQKVLQPLPEKMTPVEAYRYRDLIRKVLHGVEQTPTGTTITGLPKSLRDVKLAAIEADNAITAELVDKVPFFEQLNKHYAEVVDATDVFDKFFKTPEHIYTAANRWNTSGKKILHGELQKYLPQKDLKKLVHNMELLRAHSFFGDDATKLSGLSKGLSAGFVAKEVAEAGAEKLGFGTSPQKVIGSLALGTASDVLTRPSTTKGYVDVSRLLNKPTVPLRKLLSAIINPPPVQGLSPIWNVPMAGLSMLLSSDRQTVPQAEYRQQEIDVGDSPSEPQKPPTFYEEPDKEETEE